MRPDHSRAHGRAPCHAYCWGVRIALTLHHMSDPGDAVALSVAFEAAGGDEVWVPETWGFDAPSLMGAIAARTTRIGIGAVLPVYSRSPALLAQTAAGVDAISGGRALLGLGTSGPQVIEGWHGVPFTRPLGELREVVVACRTVWARNPLEVAGPRPIPLPGGAGRALRMITQPMRSTIPITLATMAPGGVRLAAEIADRWWPFFISAESIRGLWAAPLAEGAARRHPALDPLEVMASAVVWVGEGAGADAARAAARREIAFYVGAMGSRAHNFYADTATAMGFGAEARAVQDAAVAGVWRDAQACVTDVMVDALAVIGPPGAVRTRLDALAAAGVATLAISTATPDPVAAVAGLRGLLV